MAESFDTDAEDSPDEQMVEQGRDNREDGNNSDESYAPADDDSLFLVREDDHSNNVGLDDILGTDLFSFDDDALADCTTTSLRFSIGLSRKRLTSQKQRAEHRS
jgi:hypothetical protein